MSKTTIFVSQSDFETFEEIKDLDYYARNAYGKFRLIEEDPELAVNELAVGGLFLRRNLSIQPVPENASFTKESIMGEVSRDLSGVIFSKAKDLPDNFITSIKYWSSIDDVNSSAVYYQNPRHEYFVNLEEDDEEETVITSENELITEGFVVKIDNLGFIKEYKEDDFIEVRIPLDVQALLEGDMDEDGFIYDGSVDKCMKIYLKVQDILNAPDPNCLYIDLIHYEMIDYGYYY